MQNWQRETYTLRHSTAEESLPVRWMDAFIPGEGVGGAASHWNGCTWRWAEYDPILRSRYTSRYGKAAIPPEMPLQDWGTTYHELEPYHHLFEKLFGLSGQAGNIRGVIQSGGNRFEAPRRDEYPQKPLEITEAGIVFSQAAESLGYRPFPQPAANSSGAYINTDGQRLGRCQYCGHCERFVCEAHAKASPDVLLYPMLRARKGFELRTHAQVLGVEYDRGAKRVTGVRYLDLESGQEYEQPADVVILAAFTMTNTRLLLLGGIGEPYNPTEQRGVVGKNFCYQTQSSVSVFLRKHWINPFLASGSSGTVIDEFNNDNFDHSGLPFLGGASINTTVTNGRPIRARLTPPGTPAWGTTWKKATADWYAHAFSVGAQGSCYPHRDNFLDLDPDYTDAFGLPLLRMTFDFRENEVRMSEWVTQKVGGICKAMTPDFIGPVAGRKGPFDTRQYQSSHVTGGTIMGENPSSSVVSPHLQHWDAQNLFVVGASVYPHNSGYNPTGPLAALALRLGDDLTKYVERPRVL
jgi:gluconate 2-dehydrogenase alpha chain